MSLSSMYQLENLTISLLEAINDKNSDVQESVSESLVALGRKKAEFIFKVCHDFLNKNQAKLSDPHKASIFNTVEKIVKENISALDENLAQSWIEISTNEMIQTRDKENPIALQTAASNLLVSIGKRYVKEVFGQLQKNFVAGQLPHLFVINTMAYLAEINPYGVVPNLTGVLTAMLPMLGMAKADIYKIAFASALCKFSEAILYYCSNKEKAPDQSIEKNYFSTQIYAAFEIFFNHWMKTSDPKLRQTTIEALGYFANLITHDKLDTDVPKIIPGILALYKKHAEPFVVSQSLYLTINAVITATPIVASMDTVFELLIKELFAQVVACLDQLTAKGLTPTAAVSLGKNQNELLRCFAELAKRYSDRILPFLLQKFEQTNEKNRIASLNVLRHLINSCGEQMSNKRQLVISGVRVILNETNPRVKKNLLQTIIAMAYHGYLGLEGGHLMIDFVMKQCALPDDNPNDKKQPVGEDCTNEHLRSSAESILTLFCTTVEDMHSILWPSLFEYLTHVEYSRAASILCKSLAHIAEAKRSINADDFTIKYESFINIPRQWDILARLIILCGVPLIGQRNRGLSALALMRNMAPNIDSLIVDLWDNAVPKLTANIEDKIENGKFVQKNWEDLIMKLLSTSLDQIASEEKLCEIAKALGRQIETLYTQNSEEKHFAFKCMGLILNKTLSKSTIDRQLDIVFNSVNHTNAHEREGCAISFGYTASAHLDSVLLKLETFSKNETKKSGGLFSSIMKDGSSKSGDPDHIKSTIVLAYGYVTYFAPKDLIISRLEANILRSVSGYAALNTKELVLRQSILKSLDTVTKCMHSDHLKKDFNFSYKNTILNQVMSYISSDNSKLLTNDIKAGSFKICSNMVKLSPKPTEADLFQLIKISTDSFYPLQLPVETPKAVDDKDKDKETSEQSAAKSSEELLHGNALYDQTSRALDDMLCTILDQDRSNAGLSGIFKHIEPWITSVNEWERLRSIKSLSRTLKHFLELCKKPKEADEKSSEGASSPSWSPLAEFTQFGHILGRVVSRCTDPSIPIRYLAIDCIESLLSILDASSAKGPSDTDKLESQLEQLVQSKNKLTKTDSTVLLSGVNELSKLICKHVPSGLQLVAFIERLIDGLLDVESHCSSASCLLLNYCVKLRGAELKDQVENLIRHLYTKLSLIQNPQAKLGTLRTIRVVFQQHLIDSLNVFLTFPIPCNNGELYSDKSILINEEVSQIESKHYIWLDHKFYNTMETIDICQSLCEDSQLISDILDFILQLWNRCLPFEEKSNVKYASLTPLIATSILNEIFSNNTTANTEQVFNRNFEKIFSAILVRTASTLSNVMPIPKSKDDSSAESSSKKDDSKNSAKTSIQNEYKKLEPCKISIDCFKSFIKCTQSFDLFEFYNNQKVWELLAQESTHVDGCSILAKGLCLHAEKNIPSILTNLALFLSAPYDCQKIAVTAFYAELMNHACCLPLIDTLMNSLLTKLIDSCALVRTLCIRGLGNMASLGTEPVQRNSTTILSAMMAGLDDKDDLSDDITHESMTSLAKIINLIDESNVRPILINILLRVRPCFEKDKAPIRASSYNLFGELARFGKGPSRDPFMEQVHSNFVGFVLHLNESDPNVRMACRRVLRQVGPLMDSKEVERMFNEALPENKTSLHYGEFINDLAKILVNEFPDKVSFYIMNSVSNFKSQWTEIRSNAVLFAGYLLGFLSKEKQSLLSKEHISNALIKLLKEDPSPLVRKKAAEAISLLSEF